MGDFFTAGAAVIMAKAATIGASFLMAVISVLIDRNHHTPVSGFLAIVAGTLMGVIAATSIVALMNWPEQVGYAIAGIFAISGNNLIRWLLRASNDPLSIWDRIRGKKET